MHNFKELKVWDLSRHFVKDIYLLTKKFPDDERFGLVQQIRRAVISIPSNIAEGSSRSSSKDFSRFLDIANGSAFEVETQLILSLDLKYISQDEFNLINEKLQLIEKMIFNFKQYLISPKSQVSNPKSQIPSPTIPNLKSQVPSLKSQVPLSQISNPTTP